MRICDLLCTNQLLFEALTDDFEMRSRRFIQFVQPPAVVNWPPVGCAVQQEEDPKKRFPSLADTCADRAKGMVRLDDTIDTTRPTIAQHVFFQLTKGAIETAGLVAICTAVPTPQGKPSRATTDGIASHSVPVALARPVGNLLPFIFSFLLLSHPVDAGHASGDPLLCAYRRY